MAHYGTLKDTPVAEAHEDIRGAHVYGINDEKLGKIDDVIFDHDTGNIRYAVVDTGGWLHSKQFLVPADALRVSAKHEDDFASDLTKERIESFPPYNESDLESENKWADYENRYRAKWVASPVQHRAETDRNITPTTYQATGNLNSERAEAATQGTPPPRMPQPTASSNRAEVSAALSPTERAVPAGTDSVVINSSANGIGGRWDTFQSRLRERRKEVVSRCQTCSDISATKRGSESATTLRKAV
ncbi:MAG TPA: PRC-barrel domain-containing protein [Candidatus Sulfotelmatobacter sp.]|nr:PRC-barrel domain-containing protein [Candidatus Sulfotelmatobacter sp.]